VEGYKIEVLDDKELFDLIIKFIEMSDKKDQQEIVNKIKKFAKSFGNESLK